MLSRLFYSPEGATLTNPDMECRACNIAVSDL